MTQSVASDRLRHIALGRVPVFLGPDLEPCFVPEGRAGARRVLIASIPKSGTYLFGQLLKIVGLTDCQVHLQDAGFTDYRFTPLEYGQREVTKLRLSFPLADALSLVRAGQFVVGHLSHSGDIQALATPFQTIFTYRDLRDAMVSQMRFFAQHGRGSAVREGWGSLPDGPEKMKQYIRFHGDFFMKTRCGAMIGWLGAAGVLRASYEVLAGDAGAEAQRRLVHEICHHAGVAPPPLDDRFFAELFGAKTLTSSGTRTRREVVWDDEIDRYFADNGGHEMNRRLGYAP